MRGVGLRPHWPHWPAAVTVAGVIVAGGAAATGEWPHAWWWLVTVTATAAAVMPPALGALSQAAQRWQGIGRAVRAGLQGTRGAGGRGLPAAGAIDLLEARVHPTVLPIPYVRRDAEAAVRGQLRAGRPVLLIGSSMVGKTKMAARIIAAEFGSWPVVIPDSKTALADLDAEDVSLAGCVIWLDDIDRLIGADGITDGALRRLAGAGNVILATIRAREYDRLRPSDQLRPPEWDVLSVFEHVFISRELTQAEQERLAAAVPDPDIRNRIATVGLGEYAGAAGQVTEALQLGAAGADRVGYALVLAAADWRRCGLTRPIPAAMLAPLAAPHLDQRDRGLLTDHDAFSAGLAWATRDINPNVALLQPAGDDSYSVYDYALDLISARGGPIPESSWALLTAQADIPELISLGYTAEVTCHRTEIAAAAWRRAADSGHADAAPVAMFNLGLLLAGRADLRGAQDAYRKAIDSGHEDAAPAAAFNLGLLLEERGDLRGAERAYRKAVASGHADQAPKAAFNLGVLLEDRGDTWGAERAYRKAADSGHPEAAPAAAVNLGLLLAERGNPRGAGRAYRKAIDSGHADQAPKAAFSLGVLLEERGDVRGAADAYRSAIASRHPDYAPRAAAHLRSLLKAGGRAGE